MYSQTLDYLFTRLPMFQRIGAAAYKADLSNTLTLCALLGNPEKKFPSVHIAGTNGKGSVSNMTASILQEAGYRTGLFTSPHFKDFRERIRVDGTMIPQQYVVEFVSRYKDDFEHVGASFFEYTFAMGMQYFADEKIDVAVVETGMGGRLDSSNVIAPVVCAITNIGFDHTAFLGNTLKAIAAEKAGIIKPETPVVIGETQDETTAVFSEKAQQQNAPITFADRRYSARFNADNQLKQKSALGKDSSFHYVPFGMTVCALREKAETTAVPIEPPLFPSPYPADCCHSELRGTKQEESKKSNSDFGLNIEENGVPFLSNINLPLQGKYQEKNVATVMEIIAVLQQKGYKVETQHIIAGLEKVLLNTGFCGRWHILSQKPLTVCDAAHNESGLTEVLTQIQTVPYRKLHVVLGMVNDKDISAMLSLFPKEAAYYFCKADIPRGLEADIWKKSQFRQLLWNFQRLSYFEIIAG